MSNQLNGLVEPVVSARHVEVTQLAEDVPRDHHQRNPFNWPKVAQILPILDDQDFDTLTEFVVQDILHMCSWHDHSIEQDPSPSLPRNASEAIASHFHIRSGSYWHPFDFTQYLPSAVPSVLVLES